MKDRTIYQEGVFRILEVVDEDYDIEDLKGDFYNASVNPDIDQEQLKEEEKRFENDIYWKGVYGYRLECWNSEIGSGWQEVDACWGFIGKHEDENHDIIDEMKQTIKERQSA